MAFTIEPKDQALVNILEGRVHFSEQSSANREDTPSATNPINIVKKGQDLFAHFHWKQEGLLTEFTVTNVKWFCQIFLERMGAGEVGSNPAGVSRNFVAGLNREYDVAMPVPTTELEEGTYKVIATLQLRSEVGKPTRIAAFDEVGMLQVYEENRPASDVTP